MTETSEPGRMRVRFRARVEAVTMLSEFSGTAKPVHFDPRFALVVHVLEVEPENAGIAAGADDVFLIHSPAKLFRGGGIDAAVGGEYEFSVERVQRGAGVRWTGLRVE